MALSYGTYLYGNVSNYMYNMHNKHCQDHWQGIHAITGSTVVLHCCNAYERINRKMGNLTPCKIVTPENFSSKVCTRHYIGDGNYCVIFCENRLSGGFSPNRWNITPLWLFWLSCPVLSFFSRSCAQVELLDRFSHFMPQTTCFCTRKCLLGVTTTDDVIWGKYAPKTPKIGRE